MEEIWRDIKGYEGKYQVSNLGRIKSLKGHEKFLKPDKQKNGYLQIILHKDGKIKHFYIHRLVAQAFIENSNNKPCINHIDCDRQNNNVDNLEWVTQQENIKYASKLKRLNSAEIGKKCSKPVIAINLTTGEETYFNSQHEAARQLHLSDSNICSVLKGRYKQTGNYFFKYINEKQENALF